MTKNSKFSIIIPLYVISPRFFEDFKKFEKLNFKNFEIIVVSDKEISLPVLEGISTKLILTKKKATGPAEKRDLALKYVKGEICAFIDDDAYPDENWLTNGLKPFDKKEIIAVGGPGLTPPEDSFWQKIGGYIIESYLCSGQMQNRFYVRRANVKRYIHDWPAYNLLVRTDALKAVKGYGSTFYGGEDTFLCLKLLKFGKILFSSDVIVYHHRRLFPSESLKQISGVGLHRGYFFKKYPETSRSIIYLLPTTLTVGFFIWLLASILNPDLYLTPFLLTFLFFWFLGSFSVKSHDHDLISSVVGGLGIILTHMTYGIYFIKGLLKEKLER